MSPVAHDIADELDDAEPTCGTVVLIINSSGEERTLAKQPPAPPRVHPGHTYPGHEAPWVSVQSSIVISELIN